MIHGGSDIADDISVLADCTKDATHNDLPLLAGGASSPPLAFLLIPPFSDARIEVK
jgi:hypothetical protein